MATAAILKSGRFEAAHQALASRLANRLAIADERTLGAVIAGRLRAAQLTDVTQHSRLLIAANLANAVVVVFAMNSSSKRHVAFIWGALMIAYLWMWARRLRVGGALPVSVSPRAIMRAVAHAAPLGILWGAAPALFLDVDNSRQLVLTAVSVGMLCGGAFTLATVPMIAIAFDGPLALGFTFGLAHTLTGSLLALAVALLSSYLPVLLIGVCSHARSFAKQASGQLRAESAARHDSLTGLPNRTSLRDLLAHAVDRSERYGEKFALLHVEIENLRIVNEQAGHAAGDQLLRQAADRLSDAVGDRAIVTRVGGAAFAIVARGITKADEAACMAVDLSSRFDAFFRIDTIEVEGIAKIGAALAPDEGRDPDSLMDAAEAACVRVVRGAKAHPAPSIENGEARHRRELMRDMKGGIARGEFFLQYQPILSLRSGEIEGFEALVRWCHPRLGRVPPYAFIEIAEKTGDIHALGEWILREACREAASWPIPARIAVNISGEQLGDATIDRVIADALEASGLPTRRLQVEVTESAALVGIGAAAEALTRLDARGVTIVLDDFGTGFSSFEHIQRLPVRRIKIDRSFVSPLPGHRESAAIIEGVVQIAKALDLGVTAEGIETEAQRDYLAKIGCASGQGYLFARPLSPEDARAALTAAHQYVA